MCVFVTIGQVKKCGTLKIVHEKFKSTRRGREAVMVQFQADLDIAKKHNKDIEPLLSKAQVCRPMWIVSLIINPNHAERNRMQWAWSDNKMSIVLADRSCCSQQASHLDNWWMILHWAGCLDRYLKISEFIYLFIYLLSNSNSRRAANYRKWFKNI